MSVTDSCRLVSVIVPTRDRPDLLAEALRSIRDIEGDDVHFEILVGDNGTSPAVAAIAERFGARHLRTARQGAGAARNIALRAATGDYLAFLDDDDLWLPSHIRSHLARLSDDPTLEAVFGQIQSTDTERAPIGSAWPHEVPADGDLFLMMLSGYFPQIGGTVARARVRETIGEFDESLIGDQDWDWQLRIAAKHRIGFVKQPCVLFRQRPLRSYDELQLRRVAFTRKVFIRHALPAWRRFGSLRAFARSYNLALQEYYLYFVRNAEAQATLGQRAAAFRSVVNAFRVIPVRAGRHVLAGPLRSVLSSTILRRSGATKDR